MNTNLPAITFTPETLDQLRQDLARYTTENVAQILGEQALAALDRHQRLPALLAARASDDPVAVLVRLWMLGDEVTETQAAQALPQVGIHGAHAMNLIAPAAPGMWAGTIDLRPLAVTQREYWVAADRGEAASGDALDTEHVMGVGGASQTLAAITLRHQVERALDIGTGSGIQFLLLAEHARQVVATDLSPRALEFARFNAALNHVEVDLRQGSLLEPVAGETFDLIVSNPPFVITPPTLEHHTYRSATLPGDTLARTLIQDLPQHLNPGGTAQLLVNWEVPATSHTGADETEELIHGQIPAQVSQAIHSWFTGQEVDVWVIARDVLDVAHYAETWLRDGGLAPERDRAAWEQAYHAYLEDFASRGTTQVAFGMVLIHRPKTSVEPGGNAAPGGYLRRIEQLSAPLPPGIGEHLTAVIAAQEQLRQLSDAELLNLPLYRAPDVTEERYYTPGMSDPQVVLLKQGGGWGRSVQADSALAAVVGACDGELSLGVLCQVVAELMEVDADQLSAQLLQQVRGLLEDQFLLFTPITAQE